MRRPLILLLLSALALAFPVVAAADPSTGGISGTVTDLSGEPVEDVEVCAYELEVGHELEEGCGYSAADGTYEITGLPPGNYTIVFWFFEQGGLHFYKGAHSEAAATLVPVTAGQVTPGIDEALDIPTHGGAGASISGTVYEGITGLPLEGAVVCAVKVGGGGIRCRSTGAKGDYVLEGLEAGEWNVYFSDEGGEPELGEQAYPHPVVLGASSHVEGIDVKLWPGAEISGVVRSAADGAPLDQVRVCLVEAGSAKPFGCGFTSTDGSYSFEAVPSGSYKVAFSPEMVEIYGKLVTELEEEAEEVLFPPDGYATAWWNGEPTFATAEPISILAPNAHPGVDATLSSLSSSQSPPPTQGFDTQTFPGASAPLPSAAPVPPVSHVVPKVTRCPHGFVKRVSRGKTKCVRIRKPAKHTHHHTKST